ncbi:MAG: hypothetical protein ABSC11_08120 [Smithella sp.]|jgi:spore coat protein U-like protein
MKKSLVVLAAMVMVIAMVSGVYAANTQQNVVVTATVNPMCKLGTDGTLAFGAIDPGGLSTVNATGASLAYKCSNTTSFLVSQISGPNGETATTCPGSGACSFVGVMKSTGTPADTLGYTVNVTSVGAYIGTGFSASVAVPFTGTVSVAQFQNAVPHADYTETIVVTIAY